MEQLNTPAESEAAFDDEPEEIDIADVDDPDYTPDSRALWGSEGARAIMVVLTRRLGADFARDVHNELASRTLSYRAGCPDDRRDGRAMTALLQDSFWDRLFALEDPNAPKPPPSDGVD